MGLSALHGKTRWYSGTAQFSVHDGQVGEFLPPILTQAPAPPAEWGNSTFDA